MATRIASHTQLLSDETAFLIEPTPKDLAGGIRAALQDREEARGRAERGYVLIQREYSAPRHREKVAEAYATVEKLTRP